MIRNYFMTAIRHLRKNKGYSFINIFGLAVGMAVALLIGLWVRHEISYDAFNIHKAQIARIRKKTLFNGQKHVQNGVMLPLYDELKNNYPEVQYITRLDWGDSHSLLTGDKKISKKGHFADPDILKIFTFPLIKGNVDKVLKDTYSIVLTESLARALFGKADPMGRTIKMDNQSNLVVTGVLKDIPENSSITFDFLVPYTLNIATSDFVKGAQQQWQNNFLQNYVQLKEGTNMDAFSSRIADIVRKKTNDKKEGLLFLHPMEKWHLFSHFDEWENTGGAIEYVRMFSIVGLLVLIIACINFMNLSTARSERRAREVGIRKAIGSQRRQLIAQFLGEAVITAFIAFLISLLMVKLALPLLKDAGFKDVELNLTNLPLLGVALAGCIITGLLAGSYPALYLSAFKPVKVLKGAFSPGKGASLPRKILVVVQFSCSVALIIGVIIVFQQIQHARNRPLGYDPNNLIGISLSSDLQKNYLPMKRDLLATDYVAAVSKSSSPMTGIYNNWGGFSWAGMDPGSSPVFSAIMVDYDYEKATGLSLKEGRFFSRQFATDSNAVVLNEAAVKLMGFKHPMGETVKFNDEKMTVIGVARNVLQDDPFKPVEPAIMLFRPYFVFQGLIRLKDGIDVRKAMTAIQPVVEKYNPAYPFDYKFTDEEFNNKFQSEQQAGKLSGIFAALAIFISCLGLFGLASFMAERRTREIGVRKVLGASVPQLWLLLSKEFILLVVISCLIASPLAWYFMHGWLLKYDYRISISPLVFASTAVLAIVITLVTVSFQAIKAAVSSPVKSLRTD
ncbi:MAG: ABC transporter permease [Chitinophagaceae bacterium]|nr:ABC transporter permease [Chitinophagaceae bacterium]